MCALTMLMASPLVRAQQAGLNTGVQPSPGSNAPIPAALKDVGIDQKLNAQIDPNLQFVDETGKIVRLGDYFGKRPMVLTLVYLDCPMLCTLVLNDLDRTMTALPQTFNCGEQFDVLTISFDPKETFDLAAKKKASYIRSYGRAHGADGWHFLTGDQDSIKKLTDTVGFRYTWDPKYKQFIHASGIMVLTPDGKVSKYFYGVEYTGQDLRLALTEAAGGKISAPVEQVLLYCFQYDPATGKYTLVVVKALQIAAVLTMALFGTFWFVMYRRKDHSVTVNASADENRVNRGVEHVEHVEHIEHMDE
jgi:protein SCO1/2